MISKKQLLADNKFKIGFEFEFVAYDLYNTLTPEHFRKLRIDELYLFEMNTCFDISKKDKSNIENLLTYAGYHTNKFEYFSAPDDMIEYGPDRIIALFGLVPTTGVYRKVGDLYKDVTDEITDKIINTDRTDIKRVESLIRSLRKCYVDSPVLGKYVSLTKNVEDFVYKEIIREFKARTGFKMKRVESYSDRTKKKPGWYLTEEYTDGVEEDDMNYGFEIVTPPLPPMQALDALRQVLDFIRADTSPLKMKTGYDCGIHINISHEDKTKEDVNQVYYGMMFDEIKYLQMFGRVKQHMCAPLRPIIIKEIKKLTRDGAITLDGLDDTDTRETVLDIIESYSDFGGLKSARFTSMEKWGYTEYRMAGGKKYETKYKETEKLVIELLRFTMGYGQDISRNRVFLKKVRDIMVSAGGKVGTGPSTMETLPDVFSKFPKAKRKKRGDSDKLLNKRDR